jgi:ABC-2 type transport system ATP-binding protein
VFMSSHVLSEVEAVADRVSIIRRGVIVDTDDIAVLRRHAGQRVTLEFAGPVTAAEFEALPGVDSVRVEGSSLSCLLRGEADPLLQAAARHRVLRWTAQDRDLDDLFLDFYRDHEPREVTP